MKIHHIGYLVDKIEDSFEEMEKLGFVKESDIIYDQIREAFIMFIKNGYYIVELIAPSNEESPIYGLRKRFRNSPYHICYETSDINGDIENFTLNGYLLIKNKEIAPAIDGSPNVVFLMNKKIGMVELVER